MQNYYFTYSNEGHPFVGGWTKVVAVNFKKAVSTFRNVHPDKYKGTINCAGVYEEKEFYKTRMPFEGNFGKFEQELLMGFEDDLDVKWDYLETLTSWESLHLLQMVCGYSHETANAALYALTGYNSFESYMCDNLGITNATIIRR